jgi:hypothetical protein
MGAVNNLMPISRLRMIVVQVRKINRMNNLLSFFESNIGEE